MAGIVGNKVKESISLDDEIIAKNMLTSLKGSTNAYLDALMTSTTPEVRAVYASSLNQLIGGHSALTELAVKREWGNPYIDPRQQLTSVYGKVQSIMENMQQ